MENHIRLTQPSNLNKYVEELNTKMKEEFTNTLTKIYNDDMKKYDDIINIIIQLPFVKRIIEENNSLREKLKTLDQSSDNVESIKLEISDKPISTSYVDLDKITFNQRESLRLYQHFNANTYLNKIITSGIIYFRKCRISKNSCDNCYCNN